MGLYCYKLKSKQVMAEDENRIDVINIIVIDFFKRFLHAVQETPSDDCRFGGHTQMDVLLHCAPTTVSHTAQNRRVACTIVKDLFITCQASSPHLHSPRSCRTAVPDVQESTKFHRSWRHQFHTGTLSRCSTLNTSPNPYSRLAWHKNLQLSLALQNHKTQIVISTIIIGNDFYYINIFYQHLAPMLMWVSHCRVVFDKKKKKKHFTSSIRCLEFGDYADFNLIDTYMLIETAMLATYSSVTPIIQR